MKPEFDKMEDIRAVEGLRPVEAILCRDLRSHLGADTKVCGFRVGDSEFMLQDFYQAEFANNSMYQIMVPDAQEAWRFLSEVVAKFDGTSVRPPKE